MDNHEVADEDDMEGVNNKEKTHLPYRTLRWEWMIRLASSGVRSSRLGLSWESDMDMAFDVYGYVRAIRVGAGAERRSRGAVKPWTG